MLCTCLIAVVILIGLVFGFGVYKHGFHKLKEIFHECHAYGNATACGNGRPFLGYPAPPPAASAPF